MRLVRRLWWMGVVGSGSYWLVRYFRPKHSTLVLSDKVVIITGASSGIGRALAFAFAQRGARVVLVARTAERLEAVRREIEPYSADALVIPADITDEAQRQQVVDRTLETFGRIDILVNNAGYSLIGPAQDQDLAKVRGMLELNLWAPIRLTQMVLPVMLENHHGYIMNIGSALGRVAMPLFAPYVASKVGLSGFSDALRRELAGTGVHVTLVLPGWTRTEMIAPGAEEILERYGYTVEHPDEVAEGAILGLVRGENEVVLGGLLAKLGVLGERYAPLLVRWYWRLRLTPEWAASMGRVLTSDSD